jgi:hypothetical protein
MVSSSAMKISKKDEFDINTGVVGLASIEPESKSVSKSTASSS